MVENAGKKLPVFTFISGDEHNNTNIKPPRAQVAQLDFEFLRECMKINQIRPKVHFLTRIEIKITCLVLLFCFLLCV